MTQEQIDDMQHGKQEAERAIQSAMQEEMPTSMLDEETCKRILDRLPWKCTDGPDIDYRHFGYNVELQTLWSVLA